VFQATPTPKDREMKEPTPGTSGATEETKEPNPGSSGDTKDKYKSTGRAMILSPDGKLIPFRMMDKLKKDDGGHQEDGNTSDPQKYKYIL